MNKSEKKHANARQKHNCMHNSNGPIEKGYRNSFSWHQCHHNWKWNAYGVCCVSGWIAFDNIRRIKRALAGLAERTRRIITIINPLVFVQLGLEEAAPLNNEKCCTWIVGWVNKYHPFFYLCCLTTTRWVWFVFKNSATLLYTRIIA